MLCHSRPPALRILAPASRKGWPRGSLAVDRDASARYDGRALHALVSLFRDTAAWGGGKCHALLLPLAAGALAEFVDRQRGKG